MRSPFVKIFSPAFLAMAIIACGGGPHIDTTNIGGEFPNNQNPMGLLEARGVNHSKNEQGMTIGYTYWAHKYCGIFLRGDGMILTHSECLTDSKTNIMVKREDIRVYFRNPSDEKTEEIKIARILSVQKVHGKDWVWLEPEGRNYLLNKYGGLPVSSPFAAMRDSDSTFAHVISLSAPDGAGVAKFTRGDAAILGTGQMPAAAPNATVPSAAARSSARNAPVGAAPVVASAAPDTAAVAAPAPEVPPAEPPVATLPQAPPVAAYSQRLRVQMLSAQELRSHGGVVLVQGTVVSILPRSPNREANRTEMAIPTSDLPL